MQCGISSEWRQPNIKHIWFTVSYLNCGAWQINFVADYSQIVWAVAEVASSKGHTLTTLINGRDSAHGWCEGFSTPCMCTHSSCPDWPHISLSAAIHDFCTMTHFDTMCCLLRLAQRRWSTFLVIGNCAVLAYPKVHNQCSKVNNYI